MFGSPFSPAIAYWTTIKYKVSHGMQQDWWESEPKIHSHSKSHQHQIKTTIPTRLRFSFTIHRVKMTDYHLQRSVLLPKLQKTRVKKGELRWIKLELFTILPASRAWSCAAGVIYVCLQLITDLTGSEISLLRLSKAVDLTLLFAINFLFTIMKYCAI